MAITLRRRGRGEASLEPSTAASPEVVDPQEDAADAPDQSSERAERRPWTDFGPLPLIRAAHPSQGLVVALGLASAAALSGRPTREVGTVLATVLVGQAVLGWHNDLVDRRRDVHHRAAKPMASGTLDPGTTWFALAVAVLLVIPLAVSTGVLAGSCYLVSVAIGLVGNVVLRRGLFSWLSWAASYALYPAYLSFGGWGGAAQGDPPTIAMTAAAAALGVGVHFLGSLWGLEADHEDGWTYLPLRLGLRLGATRLLAVSATYVGLALAAAAFVGSTVGLSQ